MEIQSSSAATMVKPGDAALFDRGRSVSASDFASVLGKMERRGDEKPEDFARRAAESFVAIGLVQPVLSKLRESSQAAPPFAPTQAEKQFRSLADAELAQRIVRSQRFGLVDRIAEQLISKIRETA